MTTPTKDNNNSNSSYSYDKDFNNNNNNWHCKFVTMDFVPLTWDLQLSLKLFLHNKMWLWSRFTIIVMYSDEISVRLESMKMFQYFWIRVVVSEKTMSNEGGFQENLAISATPLAPQTKPSAANWSVTTSMYILFLNIIAIDGTDKKVQAQGWRGFVIWDKTLTLIWKITMRSRFYSLNWYRKMLNVFVWPSPF